MTSIAAKRVQLAKAAGIAPSLPSPTIRRPNRPANPTTTSDRPKAIAKPTVANPGPHVSLSPAKTTQKALNAHAAGRPKG
jgi:hypothetical protein